MSGEELWDYMAAIQSKMQPGTTAGFEWKDLPEDVRYVWVKAAVGLDFNGKVIDGQLVQ